MSHEILIITHPRRRDAEESAEVMADELARQGVTVRRDGEVGDAELVVVLGGDGTILDAAERTRPSGTPILGINYGHVGFLAEVEPESIPRVVEQIVAREWTLEKRMTINVDTHLPDGNVLQGWALNEAALEKTEGLMVEVKIGVDGRGLSTFSCDSVLMATATGSTAYAFSAGGPVVWPNVEAMLLVPVAAHALFTRPLVVGPDSTLEITLGRAQARMWCDGRRVSPTPPGSKIKAYRSDRYVYLARLNDAPFSGRLVRKFNLPVEGWGNGRDIGDDRRDSH